MDEKPRKKLQLNPDKKPEKKIRAKKREKAEHKSKAIIHRERGKETEEKQGKQGKHTGR